MRRGGLGRYLALRLALALPLALGAATLVFALLEAAPGTPADTLLGDRPVPAEVRTRIEQAYGLGRSPAARYSAWLGALAHGDLGFSVSRSRPVTELFAAALPATLLLSGSALLIQLGLGLAAGIGAAARSGTATETGVRVAALAAYAMPSFWLGLVAIALLAYGLDLFPAASMTTVGAEAWAWPRRLADRAWHLALPAAVLGLGSAAAMASFVRAGTLSALDRGFVRAARARGVGPQRVLWAHALRASLAPVVNLAALSLPALVSGSLAVEVVFAWPGMGRLTYDAILAQDVPVVLAATLLATLVVVVGNVAADLALAALDPRVRLSRPERARA